jgi:hypothetical protein
MSRMRVGVPQGLELRGCDLQILVSSARDQNIRTRRHPDPPHARGNGGVR